MVKLKKDIAGMWPSTFCMPEEETKPINPTSTMQVSREVETEGRTCCEFVTQKVGARPCTALQRYQVASSSALICGRHFNKGVLDKEGAAEDFNHIDSDGSGFLRSVCVCACFEV